MKAVYRKPDDDYMSYPNPPAIHSPLARLGVSDDDDMPLPKLPDPPAIFLSPEPPIYLGGVTSFPKFSNIIVS